MTLMIILTNARSVSEVRLLLLSTGYRTERSGVRLLLLFLYCCTLYIHLIFYYILQSSSKASKPAGRRGCRQRLLIERSVSVVRQ